MLTKIKGFFSGIYSKVILGMGAVIGILLYWIQLKNKKANALKARIALLDTEKDADILETEIKGLMEDRKLLKKEVDDFNKSLVDLDVKRNELKEKAKNMSPKEVEDYWEKN